MAFLSDSYPVVRNISKMKSHQNNMEFFFQSFVKLLKSYPLREAEDAAYNSLQMLADLAKMEPETFSGEIDDDK